MHFKKKKKNKRPFHIQHTGWIVLGINKLSKTTAYVKKYYMYCCWKAEEHLFAYIYLLTECIESSWALTYRNSLFLQIFCVEKTVPFFILLVHVQISSKTKKSNAQKESCVDSYIPAMYKLSIHKEMSKQTSKPLKFCKHKFHKQTEIEWRVERMKNSDHLHLFSLTPN